MGFASELTTIGLGEVFQNVVEVASDTERHGDVDAPGLLVDGLTAG